MKLATTTRTKKRGGRDGRFATGTILDRPPSFGLRDQGKGKEGSKFVLQTPGDADIISSTDDQQRNHADS